MLVFTGYLARSCILRLKITITPQFTHPALPVKCTELRVPWRTVQMLHLYHLASVPQGMPHGQGLTEHLGWGSIEHIPTPNYSMQPALLLFVTEVQRRGGCLAPSIPLGDRDVANESPGLGIAAAVTQVRCSLGSDYTALHRICTKQ